MSPRISSLTFSGRVCLLSPLASLVGADILYGGECYGKESPCGLHSIVFVLYLDTFYSTQLLNIELVTESCLVLEAG